MLVQWANYGQGRLHADEVASHFAERQGEYGSGPCHQGEHIIHYLPAGLLCGKVSLTEQVETFKHICDEKIARELHVST